MKKTLLLCVMFCWLGIRASVELPRDVLAHDYHTHELSKAWYHDRFTQPAHIAGALGLASSLISFLIMYELEAPAAVRYAIALSSAIGIGCFAGALVPLIVFKFFLRLFIKNPNEEGLKQTLIVLSSRLKNAITDGKITAEDLEIHCAGIDSPLVTELIEYARALRTSQVRITWTMDDGNYFAQG